MSADTTGYPAQAAPVFSVEELQKADRARAKLCGNIFDAAWRGFDGAVRHFLRVDPDSVKEKRFGKEPLHLAAAYGIVDIVEVLINAKASVDAKDKYGQTPLHHAAAAANKGHRFGDRGDTVVQRHLAAGAKVDDVDNEGSTPLFWAADEDHAAVGERLLAAGANVDAVDNEGRTPLHWAAKYGKRAVVERLLASGANDDAVDNDGRTPLHHAAKEGHAVIVERLLAADATVDAVDKEGKTPYDLAEGEGHAMVLGWFKPVWVVTLGGKECRCNSHGIRTINDLRDEAQRKFGIEITHLIGENAEELPAIEPGITLTAVYSQPSDQQ